MEHEVVVATRAAIRRGTGEGEVVGRRADRRDVEREEMEHRIAEGATRIDVTLEAALRDEPATDRPRPDASGEESLCCTGKQLRGPLHADRRLTDDDAAIDVKGDRVENEIGRIAREARVAHWTDAGLPLRRLGA